jgi:hypothetical protein
MMLRFNGFFVGLGIEAWDFSVTGASPGLNSSLAPGRQICPTLIVSFFAVG